jgi:hypothetical protein
MRQYCYVKCDPRTLDAVRGLRYVADAGRGHGAELHVDCASPFDPRDYPGRVALVTPLTGGVVQVVPIVDDGGALLKRFKDAGLEVYDSAKQLAVALPVVADKACYEQEPVLDKDGKPTGEMQKKPGAPLRVALAISGDRAESATDPVRAVAIQETP